MLHHALVLFFHDRIFNLLSLSTRSSTLVSSQLVMWFEFFFVVVVFYKKGLLLHNFTSSLRHVKNTTDCCHMQIVASTFADLLTAPWCCCRALESLQDEPYFCPFISFCGTSFLSLVMSLGWCWPPQCSMKHLGPSFADSLTRDCSIMRFM